MRKPPRDESAPTASEEWIALPGLFAANELELDAADGLEVRANPLLIARGCVYYGVYVRERARDSQPDVPRRRRVPTAA